MVEITIDHEVVVEQVLSYVLAARDSLKNNERDFDVTFLPIWPHFYTWILQASWYSLLRNKKNLLLFFPYEWDKINIIKSKIWPFLWKIWLNKILGTLEFGDKIKFIDNNNKLLEKINSQLWFIRILFNIENVVPVFVWKDCKKLDFLSFCLNFDIKSDFNFVFCSDVFVSEEIYIFSSTEKINKTFLKKTKKENFLLNLFFDFLDNSWMSHRIISYNSSLFKKNQKNNLKYLCIVWK